MTPGQISKSIAFGFLVLSVGILQTRQVLREWNNKPSRTSVSLLPSGKSAPALEAPGTNSRLVNLNDFKGQLVLVSFWTSWCGPCRKEMPELLDFVSQWNRNSKRTFDLVWLAVDVQEDFLSIREIVTDERYQGTRFLFDTKGINADRWEAKAFPTLYVIAPDGKIIDSRTGYSEGLRIWLWKTLDRFSNSKSKVR